MHMYMCKICMAHVLFLAVLETTHAQTHVTHGSASHTDLKEIFYRASGHVNRIVSTKYEMAEKSASAICFKRTDDIEVQDLHFSCHDQPTGRPCQIARDFIFRVIEITAKDKHFCQAELSPAAAVMLNQMVAACEA